MIREAWKAYYRMVRIHRREASKAALDAVMWGTGFVFISDDGFVNHILPEAVLELSLE